MIVALVLLSALLHAGWNAMLRVEPDKDRGLVGAIACGSLFACVIAGIRWAFGAVPFETAESLGWTLLAGGLEAIYFYTLARALDIGPLGAVYTVSRGGALVVVWPLSIVLFAEVATVPALAGTGVVLGGLVLSSLAPSSQRTTRHYAGIAWAAACALSIAGYHLSYKAALLSGGGSSAVFALSLSFAGAINIVRIGRAGRAALRALLPTRGARIALMGTLCGGSFLILMEALARGGSGYVLTLRNTSVLFAAGLAWRIGEKPRRVELVGAALVAVGATLMAL